MSNVRPIKLDQTLITDIGDVSGVGSEKDLFGVEVELEGRKILTKKEAVTQWWTPHQDGSLRVFKEGAEAWEYVFNKPRGLADTKKAVAALFDYLNNNPGTEVFESYRTSIHVHVNCLNETVRTICNYITLAIIFDELLVSQNGATRIGNNFCLRGRDAEGQINDLIQSVQQYGSLYNIQAAHRYSSVNVGSLMKFGTIEFRSLECTANYERLIKWIAVLQGLKEAARTYEDPREIISKFSRRGPLGFMIRSLGDQYGTYAGVQGAYGMLRDGMRLAQDFAFCSDWKQPDPAQQPNKKPNKGAKYEEFAQLYGAQPQPGPVPAHQWAAAQPWGAQPDGPIPMPGPQHVAVDLDDDDFQLQIDDDD